MREFPLHRLLLPLLAGLLLCGCASLPPAPPPPSPPLPASFSGGDPSPPPAAGYSLAVLAAADPLLHGLLAQSAASNRNLRASSARLTAAGHLVDEVRYSRWPSIRPRAGITESRSSETDGRGGQDEQTRQRVLDAGVDGSWDLDPWGRSRLSLAAAVAEQGRAAELQTHLRNRIAAEVIRSYLRLRESQELLLVAARAVSNQTEVVAMVDRQLEGGRATALDAARARGLLSSSRAAIPAHREAVEREMHLLALLTGQPPLSLHSRLAPSATWPAWDAGVLPADPATVLRLRPDIRAAEQGLQALLLRTRVVAAEVFPVVRLAADAGVESAEAGDLSRSDSLAWSAGLRVSWPGLDMLRTRARIAAADAAAAAAVAEYEQTVLGALREVEDALSARRHGAERLGHLEEALRSATEAFGLAGLRFRDGITDFFPVLDAERERIRLDEEVAASRGRLARATVDVLEALGAGW